MALDGEFLEPLCGSWPLAVWYVDAFSPVMFECEDTSWRYVVMPMAEEWERNESDPEAQS